MLFSTIKHYLELYITVTALKVSQSLFCFTISLFHGVENYFPKLWGTGISDAILFLTFALSKSVECENNHSHVKLQQLHPIEIIQQEVKLTSVDKWPNL